MTIKRLYWTLRLLTIRSGEKRVAYARKAGIYGYIGEKVSIQSRNIPLYSELIKFHNNISVARNVDFVTHDIIHGILNRYVNNPENKDSKKFGEPFHLCERIGCIEVMDNVFIGSNSVILYGTRIGPNVIIASGSVVTKDCEPNSVYAGVPARKVGSFSDYIKKRYLQEKNGLIATTTHNQHLTTEEKNNAWKKFYEEKNVENFSL